MLCVTAELAFRLVKTSVNGPVDACVQENENLCDTDSRNNCLFSKVFEEVFLDFDFYGDFLLFKVLQVRLDIIVKVGERKLVPGLFASFCKSFSALLLT